MITPVTSSVLPHTRCKHCLCCDAVVVVFGEPLCAACDDGTHPPLPGQPSTASMTFEEDAAAVGMALGATDVTIHTQPIKEEPVRNKVTDEQKKQIGAADPGESCSSIGKRLGLPPNTVDYQRRMIRQRAGSISSKPAKDAAHQIGPGHALANTVSATFLVTGKIVDEWWKSLPLSKKAEIFAGNYVIRLESTVS